MTASIQPSNEREIVAAFAFLLPTSPTDQVEGFGGGAKRSIGSKLLSSELEALYKKVQSAEKK